MQSLKRRLRKIVAGIIAFVNGIADHEEAFALPRAVNFVSGSSRTGNTEKTYRLHVSIVRGA